MKFVAIGHMVNDTEPVDHLGGGVSYTAITANKLGYEAHIITKCAAESSYIKDLQKIGIHVHLLPTKQKTITTFRNVYDDKGKRKQKVLAEQEKIVFEDFSQFPKEILKDAIILVAPIIGEVDTKLFPLLSEYGILAVTPQGYFRRVDDQNNVSQHRWMGFEKDIAAAQVVIFSEEDITIEGKFDEILFNEFKKNVPVTVLTKGDKGSTVYSNGQEYHVTAFHLRDNEIKDFTGAGDVYAAAFLAEFKTENNLKQAAMKASLFAGLKIIGFGGIGTDSIPNNLELENFFIKNQSRLDQFYAENNGS